MKPIDESEFEICEAPVVRQQTGINASARRCLATLYSVFQVRDAPERLPLWLRQDAGLDELDIERRRIARAPLIR